MTAECLQRLALAGADAAGEGDPNRRLLSSSSRQLSPAGFLRPLASATTSASDSTATRLQPRRRAPSASAQLALRPRLDDRSAIASRPRGAEDSSVKTSSESASGGASSGRGCPPRLSSTRFSDSERRRRSASISMIFTWTTWPWATTSRGILDVVLRELRDVHEALDAGQDLDEGAERDDLRHACPRRRRSRE